MKLLTDAADEVAVEAVHQEFIPDAKNFPLLVHTKSIDAQSEVGVPQYDSRMIR